MNDESKNSSSGDISSLELKLLSAHAELQKVRREAEEQAQKALQTHEMLLMELQKAFHESEDYFVKWKQAEELGGNLSLNVESVTRGAFHEQGSHRYYNLTLGGVDLFERRWDHMDLRLVEHHGNAGLMVFKPVSGGAPFYSWKQDGEEGGRPFQLIIPSNSASKKWLLAAPASDLILAQECAAFLVSDLAINGVPPGSQLDWLDVAKRLLNQILEIPERFRYDSVKIFNVKLHGNPITIDFEIRNAYHRQELLGDIRFSCDYFKTGSSKFRITKLDDFYNTELVYDFTKATTIEQKRAPWQKLSVRERDIALEILKEMPNFIWHFCEKYKQYEERKIQLQNQAKKTYRKAGKISGKKNQTGFFALSRFTPASNRRAKEDKAYGLVSAAATAPLLSKIETQNSSISALQSERSTLVSERSTLDSEREALSTSLAESKAELETRARLLVEKATQIHLQEAQIASLESERDALASDLSAKTTLLDVLSAGRVAQDEQMEKMLQEKQTLVSHSAAHSARIADLEKENADLRAHTKSIDEEFGKAEGQLEIIKDIFLREALR
jgi:hypothetical protein